jgi:hypothetical protein
MRCLFLKVVMVCIYLSAAQYEAKASSQSLFICSFSKGTHLNIKTGDFLSSKTLESEYIFSVPKNAQDNEITLGSYKSIRLKHEMPVFMYVTNWKINVFEKVDGEDGGFYVTIFLSKKKDGKIPAVHSSHSYDTSMSDFYKPSQQLGWCE